jgi:hypothetical protein
MTKIDSLITAFTNHFHTIITIIFGVIVLYIVRYPYYLEFYFENTLGRASLILFIIAMTYCNPILGALATVAFIGLYNSRVIEGFDSANKKIEIVATPNKDAKKDPKPTDAVTPGSSPKTVSPTADAKKSEAPLDKSSEHAPVSKSDDVKPSGKDKKKEAFHNMASTPADLNEGRNRMLTIEDYMRIPKFSNQMSFSKYYESSVEPMANYSGPASMQSTVSLAN